MAGSDPRRAAPAEADPPDRPVPWRSPRTRSSDPGRRRALGAVAGPDAYAEDSRDPHAPHDPHDVADDERTRAAASVESGGDRRDGVIALRPRQRPRHAANRSPEPAAQVSEEPVTREPETREPVTGEQAVERPVEPDPPRPERVSRTLTAPREPVLEAPSGTEAGRAVVEALGHARPADRAGAVPEAGPSTRIEPAPRRETAPTGPTPATATPSTVVFPPRTMWRATLGIVLLGLLVAAGGAGVAAYQEPTTAAVGIAAILVVAALLVYGVRAASPAARLTISGGQLEYVRGSQREVFDLTSRYTRIEVIGTPGRRGWRVLLGRFGKTPLVVDAAIVDPRRFTEALDRYRHR